MLVTFLLSVAEHVFKRDAQTEIDRAFRYSINEHGA